MSCRGPRFANPANNLNGGIALRRERVSQRRFVLVSMALVGLAAERPLLGQSIPKPIGEEAFRVLAAFYDYDTKIPLEARVVELKDGKASVRRKVVFRSARSFLVPGHLEFPKKGLLTRICARVWARGGLRGSGIGP